MRIELKMPRLSPEMKKGVLCAWLKEEGERFEKGEAIYEIETDKVVNHIEADKAGTVTKIVAEEGDELEPGALLAVVEE